MEILKILTNTIKTCANVIKWGVGLQASTRKQLVSDLQSICVNCDAAYDAILGRLTPVKNTFGDRERLAMELRAFAADSATRSQFKPEYLCSQIDHLLAQLSSNLDPLKYSVDHRRVTELRQSLMQLGNFDGALLRSYDELARQLDRIATEIQAQSADSQERCKYAQHVIQEFEDDLTSSLAEIREAKSRLVDLI
jgi:Fe-S-cluster formation regulator IscX/YfhJ